MKVKNYKTFKLKLLHNQNQYTYLINTVLEYTEAYNEAVDFAFNCEPKNFVDLHNILYYDLRSTYNLNSNYVLGVLHVAFETYRSQKKLKNAKTLPQSKFQSPRLNKHLYSINPTNQTISIATNNGRQRIQFQCRKDIALPKDVKIKSATLTHRLKQKQFYLNVAIEYETEIVDTITNPIGVDLGVNVILATSDLNIVHDFDLAKKDKHYTNLRKQLQAKDTRSSNRRLKTIGSHQTRLRKDVDHVISKSFVEYCQLNNYDGIIFEDLTNIRKNMKSSKDVNRKNHMWSYYRLQTFITYKALDDGIAIEKVLPMNTSIRCPVCNTIDKNNRPSRDQFKCINCNTEAFSDFVAAYNIQEKFLGSW